MGDGVLATRDRKPGRPGFPTTADVPGLGTGGSRSA